MRRRPLRAILLLSGAALGCNALLGIDDGVLALDVEAGTDAGDTDASALDASTLTITSFRRIVYLPHGRTVVARFLVPGADKGVTVDVSGLPPRITAAKASVVGEILTVPLTSSDLDTTASTDATATFTFRVGEKSGVIRLPVMTRPSGTVDGPFHVLPSLPLLGSLAFSDRFFFVVYSDTSVLLQITRVDDDGTNDTAFRATPPAANSKCLPLATDVELGVDGGAGTLFVAAGCTSATNLFALDGSGHASLVFAAANEVPFGIGSTPTARWLGTASSDTSYVYDVALPAASRKVIASFRATSSSAAGDGLVIGGFLPNGEGAVTALTSKLEPDTTFGDAGFATLPDASTATSDVVEVRASPDAGSLAAVPRRDAGTEVVLARLTPRGMPGGRLPAAAELAGDGAAPPFLFSLDDRGRVLVASESGAAGVRLARVLIDGGPDTAFADGGSAVTFPIDFDAVVVATDLDGMIVTVTANIGLGGDVWRVWP